MHSYTSIPGINQLNPKLHSFKPLVDRIQVPIQIEDDPIHWLIGVKCRKITHGYCTLQIVSGLHKWEIARQNGTKCTQDNTDIQAREFKFKSIMCVSAHGVTFMHALIEELYAPLCITVSYQQQTFIYMWLFAHIDHLMLSSRKFIGSAKKQQYPQTHAVYSSIYFNKLFRYLFAGANVCACI